jgi:ribose transport system permease protein
VPLALLVGAAVGACCGLLVAQVSLQPIVATLGVFLVLNGLNLALMPSPTGPAPAFFGALSGRWHGIPMAPAFLIGPLLIWWALCRTPFVRTLLAVGGDDRVAFSAGIDVRLVRLAAYAIGGLFAAFAGLALTALIQSGDATVGPPFTLQAVTAVALGGTSLAGGRGGMTGSVLGALCLFLIQNLLTNMNVSFFWVQIVFGVALVLALIVNAGLRRLPRSA